MRLQYFLATHNTGIPQLEHCFSAAYMWVVQYFVHVSVCVLYSVIFCTSLIVCVKCVNNDSVCIACIIYIYVYSILFIFYVSSV